MKFVNLLKETVEGIRLQTFGKNKANIKEFMPFNYSHIHTSLQFKIKKQTNKQKNTKNITINPTALSYSPHKPSLFFLENNNSNIEIKLNLKIVNV